MTSKNPLDNLFSKTFERPSDLICCAYGLKNSEIDTLFLLMSGPKTVEDLTATIYRTEAQSVILTRKSTIQRALQNLMELGLVERSRRVIDRGGYFYEYSAISREEVRKRLLEQLDQWYHRTRSFLLENWSPSPAEK